MDIKIFAVLLLFWHVSLCAKSMEEFKKWHPTLKKSTSLQSKSKKIKVRFRDINSVDLVKFEQKYGVVMEQCILEGVCIFTTTKSASVVLDALTKEEEGIQDAAIYEHYNMKPY